MTACPKPPKPIRDAKHLANIRQCCCVICGFTNGIEPHHLLRTPEKAMGRRSGDNWAVPLCGGPEGHHRGPDSPHGQGDERAWFVRYRINGQRVAELFWHYRNDPPKMQRLARRLAEVARRAAVAAGGS